MSFQRLLPFVPVLSSWPEPKPRGETDWPTLVTRVYADYDRGSSRLELELMDAVKNPHVMTPLLELLRSDEAAVQEGVERIKIREFPGIQEWTDEARKGYVVVLLADRFTVKFTGTYVESLNVIRDAVAKVDLEKLAGLK